MSYCKTKMHERRFRIRLRPKHNWDAYSVPQPSWLDVRDQLRGGWGFMGMGKKEGKESAKYGAGLTPVQTLHLYNPNVVTG